MKGSNENEILVAAIWLQLYSNQLYDWFKFYSTNYTNAYFGHFFPLKGFDSGQYFKHITHDINGYGSQRFDLIEIKMRKDTNLITTILIKTHQDRTEWINFYEEF